MADRESAGMRPWLEMELAGQLTPVSAPDGLWNHIERGRMERSRVSGKPYAQRVVPVGWVLWPVLALLMLFASGDLLWQMTKSRGALRDITQLSSQELRLLANASPACDFWSDDPGEIRQWVKTRGDIDVELPAARSRTVRMVGARLVRVRGTMVAAIAYRTDEGRATLLVSNRRSGGDVPVARHLFSRAESADYPRLFSWSMRGQVYEIAAMTTRDSQGACLLCHVEAHGQM